MNAPPEERSAWIMLAQALIGYPLYIILLFVGRGDVSLTEAGFAWPMIWITVGSIVLSIIARSVFRVHCDPDNNERDERDRRIGHWSYRTEYALVATGAIGGLLLAMVDADRFWIANAIFLGFYLAAAVGSVVKIVAYRRGLPSW